MLFKFLQKNLDARSASFALAASASGPYLFVYVLDCFTAGKPIQHLAERYAFANTNDTQELLGFLVGELFFRLGNCVFIIHF